jgi:hypothetical protein
MPVNAHPRVDTWRNEAAEARALAARYQDPEAQRSMLEVASAYDLLARLEEAARADTLGERAGPALTGPR